MADLFDIVDIIHDAVEKSGTGYKTYKNRSETGVKVNHIVVNTTGVSMKEYINKSQVVNVNIFTRPFANGMADVKTTKAASRKVRESLTKNISHPAGMYFNARIVWEEDFGEEMKEGFNCLNIRLEVITELN